MHAGSPTIIFVHLGRAPVPRCMEDSIRNIRRISPTSRIKVIADESHGDRLSAIGDFVSIVSAESLSDGVEVRQFQELSKLRFDFRNDFWFHTSARFLVLAEYMRRTGVEDVIHLENDVSLHFDPATRLDAFRSHAELAVPLDRHRAIAGIVWYANANAAIGLSRHILANSQSNDMESLGAFCDQNPDIAKPLPTLPLLYAKEKGLSAARYCQGLDQFGGIFDAAAIGQYIGGVHWLNNPHDTRFFINESSDLDLREFDLSWDVKDGVRFLSLNRIGERVPVLSIHAHSKDIPGISPFNHGVATIVSDVVTGERLQAIADLTIGSPMITRFHGCGNIRSKELVEIPQNEAGQLLVPDTELIEKCRAARVIFLYTHLMLYFKRYIAPRLEAPFVLLTHNSDHGVGLDDLDILNHPWLTRCWGQNVEAAHFRLSPLPLGLANQQWGPARIEQIVAKAGHIQKDKLLYVNLSATHPSRADALKAVAGVAGATIESKVDFEHFVSEMARHKFCLCPRGNGLDTHRFWEALYLDSIPVIIKSDWTSAYSELPLLLLGSWDELPLVDWRQAYIRIKSTAYRFDVLSLKSLVERILISSTRS